MKFEEAKYFVLALRMQSNREIQQSQSISHFFAFFLLSCIGLDAKEINSAVNRIA